MEKAADIADMDIEFLLNGETVQVSGEPATRTLLDWLRENKKLTGTKEGCNEGDCGACTVMVTSVEDGEARHIALNACILFLPQLHGKSVRTVEGLASPDGTPHPVQRAMVDQHGSQCGFCTPGIVMSLATAHRNGDRAHNDVLAGNLCRCTGYAPIIRAADEASVLPVPEWLGDETARLCDIDGRGADDACFAPTSIDDLATWYAANPDATLIAGATDVGLWVTKRLADLSKPCFVGNVREMRESLVNDSEIRFGAAVTLNEVRAVVNEYHPDLAEMIRRFGSLQVRNAATIGGNIANGSPIGDGPPALIALGAALHLRRGDARRSMPLEEFFIAYGKQDRQQGEFVEAVSIPRQADNLRCYKVSKRFDQDISALCGCFNIEVQEGRVVSARIAFGGMAATPKRASAVEKALVGEAWNDATMRTASEGFAKDYAPIDDMRASADYRLETARNLLTRYFAERQLGHEFTRVLEVNP